MSLHHHMNYLSPYARGIVHGWAYGILSSLLSGGAVWLFLKL